MSNVSYDHSGKWATIVFIITVCVKFNVQPPIQYTHCNFLMLMLTLTDFSLEHPNEAIFVNKCEHGGQKSHILLYDLSSIYELLVFHLRCILV